MRDRAGCAMRDRAGCAMRCAVVIRDAMRGPLRDAVGDVRVVVDAHVGEDSLVWFAHRSGGRWVSVM